MKTQFITILSILLCVCGCDRKSTLSLESKTNSNSGTNASGLVFTEADFSETTSEKVEKLEKELQALRRRLLNVELERYSFQSINLTPEQKGFQRLDAGFVTLLIMTDSVDPYLDGFKIKIKVGNPTSGDLSAAQLVCTTYKPSSSTNSTPPWASWRSVTNSVSARFAAGSWTQIEFILAPATIVELRNASVSLEVNEVFLREPSQRNR